MLHVVQGMLHVACCMLHAACCMLRAVQGMFESFPKMSGNEDENDGAAWIAGKAYLPMLSAA